MLLPRLIVLMRLLGIVAMLLVLKVTASIVLGYRDYLPPDFANDFLRGREAYFWGAYSGAFYAHLVAGPASLLLGTFLVSDRFRMARPRWHRRLGRVQGGLVLMLLVPSGVVMACYAAGGAVSTLGLGTLAIATAACMLLGWKAAVERKFSDHRRWMSRTYMLLLSAVVIRLIGGAATVAGLDVEWLYPLSTWVSWLGPLLVYEAVQSVSHSLAKQPRVRSASLPAAAE